MRSRILISTLFIACFFISTPNASAQVDTTAVTARMDVIIKQMEALRAEFATLVASIGGTATPQVQGASNTTKSVFTMSLANGETNEDIKRIQRLLATDPEIYPYGVASGFYGPKTEEGIKNFQTRFGLDPVGVVGPATKSLLELFMNAYPDEKYPAGVLSKKPQVQGVSTSVPSTPVVITPAVTSGGTNVESITAKYDGDEANVRVRYTDDTSKSFDVEGSTKIAVVDVIASKIGATRAQVLGWIEFTSTSDDEDEDEDEDEENDNAEGIESIEAEVGDGETEIRVRYEDEDEDDEKFTVDEDEEDDIIEAVAEELDIDEDDVEDLIEFDFGDIDYIRVSYLDEGSRVIVYYESGATYRFDVDEEEDGDIIEEIANELDEDEEDVEDWVEFD